MRFSPIAAAVVAVALSSPAIAAEIVDRRQVQPGHVNPTAVAILSGQSDSLTDGGRKSFAAKRGSLVGSMP